MQKVNYKYRLANGAEIEYALTPDSDVINVLQGIIYKYAELNTGHLPDNIWVSLKIAAALHKQSAQRNYLMGPMFTGAQILRLQTHVGSVTIIPKANLEFPIFYGTEQEYEDSCFNLPMEKILSESTSDR